MQPTELEHVEKYLPTRLQTTEFSVAQRLLQGAVRVAHGLDNLLMLPMQ